MVAILLGNDAFQRQLASRNLETLHEVGGAREEDAPFVLHEGEAEDRRQMALATAGRSARPR
jgi:hypothetical protein